jgi:hypothetical protein
MKRAPFFYKIDLYKNLDTKDRTGIRALPSCTQFIVITNWCTHECVQKRFPILSCVALCILACLPGSGGLECDIDCVGDIVTQKCSTLGGGFFEAQLTIRLKEKNF